MLASVLVLALAVGLVNRPSHATAASVISGPDFYNLQPTSFNVGWYTDTTAVGGIVVHTATNCSDAGTSYSEFASDGYVHLSAPVTVAAGTTYHVSIVTNGVPGGCFSVTSLPSGPATPISPTVTGLVTYPTNSCSVGAPGALVVATTSGAASPLAAMTSATGGYAMPLNEARASDGSVLPVSGVTFNLSANASLSISAPSQSVMYTGQAPFPTLCLNGVPIEPGTPTSTATGTPTVTPVGFVTSTPIATLAPSVTPTPTTTSTPTTTATATITNTPIPTNTLIPFPFPTGTPPSLPPPPPPGVATATSTPTATPTFTVTPVPSPSPPPPPKPVKLKAWTRIHAKTVHPDGQQSVEVHTLAGASVAMKVVYPDKASSYSASGKANKQGVWTARWTVVALQRGRASVTFTVRFGKQKKVLHRYFSVR